VSRGGVIIMDRPQARHRQPAFDPKLALIDPG
jgi:hypothetical protein